MPQGAPRSRNTLAALRPRGLGGPADLLLAYDAGGAEAMAAAAGLLGYQSRLPQPVEEAAPPVRPPRGPAAMPPVVPTEIPALPLSETPLWRLVEWDGRAGATVDDEEPPPPEMQDTRPASRPTPTELSRWSVLMPRLRTGAAQLAEGRDPDIAAMIRRLGDGSLLDRVLYRKRRRWGMAVQIILDRAERLIPFYHDQDQVVARLTRLFPHHATTFALALDGFKRPFLVGADERLLDYRLPASGSLVLVLGDLGCLTGGTAVEPWERLGRELAAAGCRPVALTPCPPGRWPPGRLCAWTLLPWERPRTGRQTPAELRARAERLLRLLSRTCRIEPGLLRDVRRLLGDGADAGTESDAWCHRWMIGRSAVAGTLDPEQARQLAAEAVRHEAPALRARVVERQKRWRAELADEIWDDELLNLDPETRAHLDPTLRAIDLPCARQRMIDRAPMATKTVAARAWARRYARRLQDDAVDPADRRLAAARNQIFAAGWDGQPDQPPPGFDPADIPPPPGARVHGVVLRHVGDALVTGDGAVGSPLAVIQTLNDVIEIGEEADPAAFWESGIPPSWAEDWGEDEFGAWVTFSVKPTARRKGKKTAAHGEKVTQKLRWIPPGRFRMGSPEDDPERVDNEGPQHEVTISRGFWLMETACPQALWQAVMGDNPSSFEGSRRPVEGVRWHEVQKFITVLNDRVPGLALTLPTEAQWEYACRAGTTTRFSFGDDITPEQVNFSSEGSGLETVPVKSRPPNPWGLYQMHGNVLEWCLDGMRDYQDQPEADPHGPLDSTGAFRVVRGGSWFLTARGVRSAYRGALHPEDRYTFLGFRCARGQVVSPAGQGEAEPAEPRRVRDAERRTAADRPGGAVLRLDRGAAADRCPLPKVPAFHVLTDRERLVFSRMTRPEWAEEIGRDRFGLWASFELADVVQKMRWIPPGRFRMGSPDDEPERFNDEGPQHEVTISQGFWLMDTACPQALWQAVMGNNPSEFQSPDRPVERVSWDEVRAFLDKINLKHKGLDLILPTEAQWEYACRAGTTTPFSFGDGITPDQVNYGGKGTVSVKSLPPNPWGLYEMHGNVWEWCQDGLRDYRAKAETDPLGPSDAGADRVMRGGSWRPAARFARSAFRRASPPGYRNDLLGFRCARGQE